MKYKLVVFDLDGTILDTLEDLTDSTNYALTAYGFPERTIEEIRHFVGNGIRKLMERAVPENTSEDAIVRVHEKFTSYYKEHSADKTKPYDGILDVLRTLRQSGVKTAVLSNKADYAVQSLTDRFFPGLFDYVAGEKQGIRKKPYPDSLIKIIDEFKLEKNDVVYVGDSEVDYKTAANANVNLIMVNWGFRTEEYLRSIGVSEIVHNMEELLTKCQK